MSEKKQIIPKSVWGPKGWHLLHSFSIYPKEEILENQKHEYYLFYKTFMYVIPCRICKIHYKDIMEIIEPLDEKKINRKYLKKWVWKIHNIVNGRLNKKKIEYKKAMDLQKNINNNDIFYFMNHVFFTIDYKNCCISDFDHLYHFFYIFGKLYPDLQVRNKLLPLIISEEYSNLSSPNQFKEWYIKNYKKWQE